MAKLTIGKVAKRAGVGVETVRFYERQGLIEQPPRTGSGYRQYPEEAVLRILLIKRAKVLGFTLKEIGELLALRNEAGTTCKDIERRARTKLADINHKIEELTKMRDILSELTESCSPEKSIGECPILNIITGEEKNG
ncbi:MAG: MerR family DNA-binding protein [Deltaproteobacteria bacterium]|nr:MerR family DNA-binding protein [Deltaproteobacteria bacterium]